ARTLSASRERIWFLGILVVAIVLRLATLTQDSLWIDEGYTLASSGHSFSFLLSVPFDSHPALHFVVVKLADFLFDGAIAVRLPSALFSVIMLVPIYLLARRTIGPVGALVTLAVLALSFTMLVYANNGRNYAQLLMLLAFAVWSLQALAAHFAAGGRLIGRETLGWTAIYTLSAALALYTHNTAILYLFVLNGVFCVWVLLSAPRRLVNFTWKLAAVNVIALVVWLPWLQVVLGTSGVFDWLDQANVVSAATTLAATLAPNALPGALLGIYFLALIAGGLLSLSRPGWPLVIILANALAFPLFVWAIGFIFKPVYMERIILPAAIGGAFAIGYLAAHGTRGWLVGALTGLALTASAWSATVYTFRGDDRANLGAHVLQDWRAAVTAHDTPDNALMICDTFTWPTIDFYRGSAEIWVHHETGVWDIDMAIWRENYGVAISGPNAMDRNRYSPWMDNATITWDDAVSRAPRIVFLKSDFLCNDGEPEILRARLSDSGYAQTRVDRWRGVSAEVWER
ncbi:MAG: glycosyltransferase family 39 protein, partial [Pseudomonadota bacterium]